MIGQPRQEALIVRCREAMAIDQPGFEFEPAARAFAGKRAARECVLQQRGFLSQARAKADEVLVAEAGSADFLAQFLPLARVERLEPQARGSPVWRSD